MKNNRIYLSGKITGETDYKAKFKSAKAELELYRRECNVNTPCRGCIFYDRDYVTMCRISDLFPDRFEVVNPADFKVDGKPWWVCMVYCIWRMLSCHYVYMLEDWQRSRGAIIEHRWAQRLGKQIIYQHHQKKLSVWTRES